jgi:hypothetical protein
MRALEREAASIHGKYKRCAGRSGEPRPNAADDPTSEGGFRDSEAEQLAPKAVIEPHTGNRRRREPSSELPSWQGHGRPLPSSAPPHPRALDGAGAAAGS